MNNSCFAITRRPEVTHQNTDWLLPNKWRQSRLKKHFLKLKSTQMSTCCYKRLVATLLLPLVNIMNIDCRQVLAFKERQFWGAIVWPPKLPPPKKLPLLLERSGHPPNTWFLGSTHVHTPNRVLIGLIIFAGFTLATKRQTHSRLNFMLSIGNNMLFLTTK